MADIEVGFPEIDIESTVAVLIWKVTNNKMEVPREVTFCLPGTEPKAWREAAIRTLREARK